jgi:UPF0755 protein
MARHLNNSEKGWVVTLLALPVILLLWLWADGTRPYLHSDSPVHVDIQRGMRTREIALLLERDGVIRSHWTFLAWHQLRFGRSLKAGEYNFAQKASALDVLSKLERGDVSFERLTILEGWTRFDIADEVAAHGFSSRQEFLDATENTQIIADLDPEAETLEGYLFPDSYNLPRHARPNDIVAVMVNRFRAVYTALTIGGTEHSPKEIVTMASLVEKETGVRSERAVVAGVFYNRLKKGMLLQCDPTVVYAGLRDNKPLGRLSTEDLKYPSPYNTYLNPGLPPGPIANPGQASLAAAVRPASTDYLFFVANLEGGHTFSRSLSDHNAAVSQYRADLAVARAAQKAAEAEARMSGGIPATMPPPAAVPSKVTP